MVCFVEAMECEYASIKKEPVPLFRIYNDTPHKLVIRLQFWDTERVALTLIERQALTLLYNRPLVLLKVTVYGKYRQWLTAEALSAGWCQIPNKADELTQVINSKINHHQVTIQLGGAYFGQGLLRRIVGEFCPYEVNYAS